MRSSMKILGIGLISLVYACKDVSKFDAPHKSAPAKESAPSESKAEDDDAEAAQQALEPIAIGGAYLTCQYQVVAENGEVWCRLEENGQAVLIPSVPTLENWVFTQNSVPYDATPRALDPATGWQWGIKLPQDTDVAVSLDVFVDNVRYHFNVTITSKDAEDDPSDEDKKSGTSMTLDKRYAYGNVASFVVDTNLLSLSPPSSCKESTTPNITLPNLALFLKAKKFTFPFKVVTEGSRVSVTLDEICGQTRPIHFAEFRGATTTVTTPIPVGSNKVSVISSLTLPAGDYEVEIHYVPRDISDLLNSESIAFGKLILESNGQLVPGRAYGNEK